ncbi:MAG TPA: ABC transporter permease [Acidimicrobiales bacterium]|nr:ABC transporter permease [Acidimicrobiales bacterium]
MRAVAGKILYLIPVLFAVSALSFGMLKLLPGDPAVNILGPSATPAAVKTLHKQLGLDQPVVNQYGRFVWNALHGDLGRSYQNNQPTTESLRQRLPVTLELLVLSQLLALLVSVPIAIRAAVRPDGLLDRISTSASFGFLALPPYIVGVVLVLLFAVRFHIFPATGYTPLTQNPFENLRSLTLPSITLALAELATYLRLLRADMITTLQEDFITMARAKGMPPRRILWRHAFRPSSFSLVTVAGLNFGRLIGGTFIVEILFALPGIGELTVNSIFSNDYLVVQGTVLLVAVGYVLVNFLVDLLYVVIDPRVRHAAAAA